MIEEILLSFDFGIKKIGVALGNTLTLESRPLEIIKSEKNSVRFDRIGFLLKDWGVDRVIIGLPLNKDGSDQEMTYRCRRFANQINGRFNMKVNFVDERYSSIDAQNLTPKNDNLEDAVAAAIILQDYLRSFRNYY
ncbi:holliday junction resolvase [Candidatus Kinetoplastibacterium oncopeltii TCC290E]|uniref:Putative pre-16S rRNA nuclease n=1 Tax=Candidatus Kinetoplastidibacterium stringomonadis TCC290E TaxID=1208920 RepID=M1LX03_9PROT|nr:Holliday junction resolvase RuvX [Candidatus Kinetoplastibacterium oncopeltii]AGF48601.1 holliday junction resolvase [Candidatus Kinetoplastibacterium oncopeltii TCC290E]